MRRWFPAVLIVIACEAGAENRVARDPYAAARNEMIAAIEADVRYTAGEIGKKALGRLVMDVMRSVPRHEYVPRELQKHAYENRPLPIGHGQTISQPYIVALMTDLLEPKPGDKVLEIGTGSGYQAAVLSRLVKEVSTIEIIEPLGKRAAERLAKHRNVRVKIADGYYGWPEHGPFDAIIVTAAATHIPPPLLDQLQPGGRLVIPVGGGFDTQQLVFVRKLPNGKVTTRQVLPVAFVPLTGKRLHDQ